MHFIVTGGAGFIGSHLALKLQDQAGSSVTVVDDFSSAHFRNLQGHKGDVIAIPCEELDWDAAFGKQDVKCIYHLASITDTTVMNQREMVERNVEGMRAVLDFAIRRGVHVVYASSGATYGQQDGVMREDMNPEPANVYGFSKVILDNLGLWAADEGIPCLGVRYFNVYGPHESHKGKMASMVYQLYRQMTAGERPRVFRNGQHERDFVYVKDAVAGTLAAGASENSGVYNIGSGEAKSFNDLIALLNNELGTSLEPEYIDNPYEEFYQSFTQADLANSKDKIAYNPQFNFADGVADYVAWLKEIDR